MLGAMRNLALDYLFMQLGEGQSPPDDLDSWYLMLRNESPEKLFRFLAEDTETTEKIYIIRQFMDSEMAEIEVQEMRPEIARFLPFNKQPGGRDPQVGPIFKRRYDKTKGISPKPLTISNTMRNFMEISKAGKAWSGFFKKILAVLELPKIKLQDGNTVKWADNYGSMLEYVAASITEKNKVMFTVEVEGKLPGQHSEYLEYLMQEIILQGDRYTSDKADIHTDACCSLCGKTSVTVFPNALRGAGINFKNVDRVGAFPGIDLSQAWKGYGLCLPCADLLYIYKNHVLKRTGPPKNIIPFTAPVAGKRALIIPYSTLHSASRQELLRDVMEFIKEIPNDVEENEESLLEILKEEKALLNLTFLWADIGQTLGNVTGVLTDVPPSRLRELSKFNDSAREWSHPIFPKIPITSGKFDMRIDLSLKALGPLFFRPGGKKAQTANDGQRLSNLKRSIAAAVYHNRPIPEERFWAEIITTAKYYWLQAIKGKDAYKWLLYEGQSKKGPFLTAAGWLKYLAWWLYYFRNLGVLPMAEKYYEPEMSALKPYFGPESGIDSLEKAFAFLLGVLYGRLLQVQKKLEVGANALTWLKRLTLTGRDLPDLYIKIRGKLFAYEPNKDPRVSYLIKSQKVRALIQEIGKMGIILGDHIDLNQTQTNYYLLLGQSLAAIILKKDPKEEE